MAVVEDRPSRRVPDWVDQGAQLSVRFLLIGAALVAAGFVFLQLRLVFVPVFVALLFASVLVPPVDWLQRRGWPPLLATWATMVAAVAVLAGLIALIVPQITGEFGDLGEQVDAGIADVEEWLTDGPLGLSDAEIDRYIDTARDQLGAGGGGLVQQVGSGALLAGELIAGALLALVLTFFFVKDRGRITSWMSGHLPVEHRDRLRLVGRRVWTTLGAYVRGTAVIGLVDALFIGVGLAILGVPLVLPLAMLTFFGAFFPLVGATVAGAVAALVALVSGGFADALVVVGIVVVVQQVEGDVLQPLVMGRALRLHPVVILLALTGGGVLAGVLGAFLAVPFTAMAVAATAAWRSDQ